INIDDPPSPTLFASWVPKKALSRLMASTAPSPRQDQSRPGAEGVSFSCLVQRALTKLHALQASGALGHRMLVKADKISAGIAYTRGDFRRIGADGLHEFAAFRDERFDCRGDAIDHDVDQQPRGCCRRTAGYPRAAHLARAIVKSN